MGDLDISKLKNLMNLQNLEIKKEDISSDAQKAFTVFDGGFWKSDGTLNSAELNTIFSKLQQADTSGDGKLSGKELKKAGIENSKSVKAFITELINKVEAKVAEQVKAAESQAAKQAKEDNAAAVNDAKSVLAELDEVMTPAEKDMIKSEYLNLKDYIDGNASTDAAEVRSRIKALMEKAKPIYDRVQAEADAKAAEQKKAEETAKQRNKNVLERPASDRGTGKVGYADTTNRIGASAWKNSVGTLFGDGKLNLKDYTTAEQVLDAILKTDAYKGLELSAQAKQVLLKDFIHNNKSFFNKDGKIHKDAGTVAPSRMELPSKASIEKAKYDQKPSAPRTGGGAGVGGSTTNMNTAQITAMEELGTEFWEIDFTASDVAEKIKTAIKTDHDKAADQRTITQNIVKLGYTVNDDGSVSKNGNKLSDNQLVALVKGWVKEDAMKDIADNISADDAKKDETIKTYLSNNSDVRDALKHLGYKPIEGSTSWVGPDNKTKTEAEMIAVLREIVNGKAKTTKAAASKTEEQGAPKKKQEAMETLGETFKTTNFAAANAAETIKAAIKKDHDKAAAQRTITQNIVKLGYTVNDDGTVSKNNRKLTDRELVSLVKGWVREDAIKDLAAKVSADDAKKDDTLKTKLKDNAVKTALKQIGYKPIEGSTSWVSPDNKTKTEAEMIAVLKDLRAEYDKDHPSV